MSHLRRSPASYSPVAAGLALAVLGSWACVAPEASSSDVESLAQPDIVELEIDSGGQLELSPGEGVGVAIEYAGEGRWSVATACDTRVSGVGCTYDVLVSTDELSPITAYEGSELEPDDRVVAPDDFAVAGEFLTDVDADGFGFTTSPGATVRVSALLYDPQGGWAWSEDPRIISWVGHGGVHRGAPSNPVDLTPDRP